MTGDCIFCSIVAGTAPAHTIWESDTHIAFLSIFPNTKGFTVVIPKEHRGSYFADVPEETTLALMQASRAVAKRLDAAFPDVGRTALVLEGFGVDHLHAKLIPLHDTLSDDWKQRVSNVSKVFETYEGYVSSHNAGRASDEELAALAKHIREA